MMIDDDDDKKRREKTMRIFLFVMGQLTLINYAIGFRSPIRHGLCIEDCIHGRYHFVKKVRCKTNTCQPTCR